jgi:FlaA1/EpsC-like NDP-sugar epimerase
MLKTVKVLINSLEEYRGIWKNIFCRKIALFAIDCLMGSASLAIAVFLIGNLSASVSALELFVVLLPVMILCRTISYFYFSFYSSFWKYASVEDFIKIAKSVFLGSVLMSIGTLSFGSFGDSEGELLAVLWIDFIGLTLFLGASRLSWRLFRERKKSSDIFDLHKRRLKKVLIFGAGDAGAALYGRIKVEGAPYAVVGFIDDNPNKLDQILGDIKVLGDRSAISRLVVTLGIEELLIACNRIDKSGLNAIVEICKNCGLQYKIAGSVMDISSERVLLSSLKKIDIEDLLGREPVSLDIKGIEDLVRGKKILVTGAGGSIGSELCRQIIQFEPSDLVMVDNCENYLFNLSVSIQPKSSTQAVFKFCSVTNRSKLERIFSEHTPDLVFHAAAYKHVPLMESNVDEAVKNNVYGAKVTADMAHKYGAKRFVLVSTDKVVRPKSIMGMTKKVAEMYIQYMNTKSQTRYMIVRFGNVLGSMGSIVPIFQKQIEDGGPVTVTHPDMSRYFMLIPEAAQLILQSAALGDRGGVFLLEMGEPVKIIDLARKMIALYGLIPDKDVSIKIVGIRPGEKLTEELKISSEQIVDTLHKKVKVLMTDQPVASDLPLELEALFQISEQGDSTGLKRMVDGMSLLGAQHLNSIVGKSVSYSQMWCMGG